MPHNKSDIYYNNSLYNTYNKSDIHQRYYKTDIDDKKRNITSGLNLKAIFAIFSVALLLIFKYNKYRKIEAHDIPKVELSHGIAYIHISETDKVVEMNLREIRKILNTYAFFIRALNLKGN